jgi:hypothetical protein
MIKDWLPLISFLGAGAAGAIYFFWSLVSGLRKRSQTLQTKNDAANESLVNVVRAEAAAWKQRYESEHEEYVVYRHKSHDNTQETTAMVLKLTADNAELKSKTDLTPILKFHQEQSDINMKIVETLNAIMSEVRGRAPAHSQQA